MKRIYASLLLLLAAGTGAFAQRHCDVKILPLIGPADNSNYACNGTVVSGYYFVNNGPDTIKSTDSFQLTDANMDNATNGADPLNFSSFYYFNGYPTGLALNGAIGDSVLAPTKDIAPGDTIIYYQWNDTVTRLSTLVLKDTYAISDDPNTLGDTVDYYVFTPAGQVPPNGTYYWVARFAGFYNPSIVVDTVSSNNFAFNTITLSCATGIHDANFNKVGFTVYPNPANSTIYFNYTFNKADAITARVMDLTGKTIKSINLGKVMPGSQKFEIDVNGIPAGTYLLEFTTGDTKGISKFTKN